MPGPLEGLKVIEMAGIGPGPLAGQMLADQGAEVIVIDRGLGKPRLQDIISRNKKSVAINLKSPAGVETALVLIEKADILIEGFRPGVMEKLGLGPDICHARNPGLIFGRMTGWGQKGPLSHTAGHDLNYLSLTGALSLMGAADAPPLPPLNLVADYGGGTMFLLFGVLSALWERSRSGKGQVVDAAMVDGVSALAGLFRSMQAKGVWKYEREANMLDGGAPFYRVYETADDKLFSVGAIEPQFFAELIEKAGLPAEVGDAQYDRAQWRDQRKVYEQVFRSKTRAEWEEIFTNSDACVAPVLTMDEAVTHPHNVERETFIELAGLMQPAPAPRFDRTPAARPTEPVPTGHDTRAILRAAGFSDDKLEQLLSDGAIFAA